MVQPGAVIPNSIPVAFNGVRRSQMEALRLTMVTWVFCWQVVADSHYFDEEPDPHPRQSGKVEKIHRYSHQIGKSDPNPHQSVQPEVAACRYRVPRVPY